jgi:hypothetical protein
VPERRRGESALFAFYLADIATIFVLLEYLYLLAAIFLAGLAFDAIAEGRADA